MIFSLSLASFGRHELDELDVADVPVPVLVRHPDHVVDLVVRDPHPDAVDHVPSKKKHEN